MILIPVKISSLMRNANAKRYSAKSGAKAAHTFHCCPAARCSVTQRFTGDSLRIRPGHRHLAARRME